MKLYHGTYIENLVEIIKDGVLDNKEVSESTMIYDEIIEKHVGANITADALYLTDDLMSTQLAYDFEFHIDTNSSDFDEKYLFVANFEKRENILTAHNEMEEKKLVEDYIKTFIPFDVYKEIYKEYNLENNVREFLYFKPIDVSKYLKENKKAILEQLEEVCICEEDYKALLDSFYGLEL